MCYKVHANPGLESVYKMKKIYAFTLIELLIVVAIIAILAAIAVPNFLEAQTRARVSRFMADIRSSATALETYHIDASTYPPPDAYPAGDSRDYWPITAHPAENYMPRRLTTPVAYITTLPVDIFSHSSGDELPPKHAPHYINDRFNAQYNLYIGDTSRMYFSAYTKAAIRLQTDSVSSGQYDRSVVWHTHSHGPDGDHDDFNSDAGYPTQYDPSNGTSSDGDIFYFGPSTGFTR